MERMDFLRTLCGLGACGCMSETRAAAVEPPAKPEAVTDARLAFARHQVAALVGFMAEGPDPAASRDHIERTGRECARLGGLAERFKGDPEGYFAAARRAWGTEFQWDRAGGTVTVVVAEGPCGCPLVQPKRTPPFWCNCSVGYQKASFAALFGREVKATLKESKLAGGRHCVFVVDVGQQAS